MNTIRCYYIKKVFENAENKFCIYKYQTEEDQIVVVQGTELPRAGSCLVTMTGTWRRNKYGNYFEAESCEVEKPTSEKGVIDYFRFLKVGIGSTRAKAIYKRFGEQVWQVLDRTPERIREVSCISNNAVAKFIEKHKIMSTAMDLKRLFPTCEYFSMRVANSVSQKMQDSEWVQKQEESIPNLISKNPYLLCEYSDLGFMRVDKLASTLKGIPADFPPRIHCAIRYTLSQAEQSGHVCLPLSLLVGQATHLLNNPEWKAIDSKTILERIAQMSKQEALCKVHGMVFGYKRYYEEYELSQGLLRLMRSSVSTNYPRPMLENMLETYMEKTGMQFAPDQKTAILSAFLHPVSIVTGGPGTGKTTLTKAILALDKQINGENANPLLLAPTGRAAKRLSETTERPAQTVHHAIGFKGERYVPSETWPKPEIDDASIIIIDESSMLDQMIASWLLQIIPEGKRLVFVGDPDRLPSVGAGNVLHEMIASQVVPTTCLHVIFRQKGGQNNPIVTNAAKIRAGQCDLDFNSRFLKSDQETDEGQLDQAVRQYVYFVQQYGADNVMLLCPYRTQKKTKVNTVELNRRIQEQVNPVRPGELVMKTARGIFHKGDRVIQLKNTDTVLNGDIGIVKEIVPQADSSEEETVDTLVVEFGDDTIYYTPDDLKQLDLAFCTTVHKSQGCEYKVVILVLSNRHIALLQRNLVYTAITRATEQVSLIGHISDDAAEESALNTAIGNVSSTKRYTLLAARLQANAAQKQEKAS